MVAALEEGGPGFDEIESVDHDLATSIRANPSLLDRNDFQAKLRRIFENQQKNRMNNIRNIRKWLAEGDSSSDYEDHPIDLYLAQHPDVKILIEEPPFEALLVYLKAQVVYDNAIHALYFDRDRETAKKEFKRYGDLLKESAEERDRKFATQLTIAMCANSSATFVVRRGIAHRNSSLHHLSGMIAYRHQEQGDFSPESSPILRELTAAPDQGLSDEALYEELPQYALAKRLFEVNRQWSQQQATTEAIRLMRNLAHEERMRLTEFLQGRAHDMKNLEGFPLQWLPSLHKAVIDWFFKNRPDLSNNLKENHVRREGNDSKENQLAMRKKLDNSAIVLSSLIGAVISQHIGEKYVSENDSDISNNSPEQLQALVNDLKRNLNIDKKLPMEEAIQIAENGVAESGRAIPSNQLPNKKLQTFAQGSDIKDLTKCLNDNPMIKLNVLADSSEREMFDSWVQKFGPKRVQVHYEPHLFESGVFNGYFILERMEIKGELQDSYIVLPRSLVAQLASSPTGSSLFYQIKYIRLEDLLSNLPELQVRNLGFVIGVARIIGLGA